MLAPLFAPDEPLSGNYASHSGQRGGEAFAFPEDGLLARLDGDGFVQFHQPLAQRVGYKAALFLGHAIYWHRYVTRNAPRRHGWFYMTAARCEQATGLSAHEQRIARHLLASEDVLEEVLAGQPARLHYRVTLDHLIRWSGLEPVDGFTRQVTWQTFSSWLNTPINFYRPLHDVAGSVAGGIYLSYLLRRQRNAVLRRHASLDGFFAINHSEVRRTLGMSVKTQRNTRAKLNEAGLLIERGNNAIHVNLQAVVDALNGVPARDRNRAPAQPTPPVVTRAVRWLASNPAHPALVRGAPAAPGPQQQLFSRWLDQSPAGQQICQSVSRMFTTSSASYVAADHGSAYSSTAVVHSDDSTARTGGCQPLALFEELTGPFLITDLPFLHNIKRQQKKQEKTTTSRARDAGPAPFSGQPECRRRELEVSSQSTATQSVAVAIQPETTNGQQLVMPKALDAVWHESVRAKLQAAPADLRQALLDELEGQLGIEGKTIHNPPGWLHGLIAAHQRGGLQLAIAGKVAADRARRQKVARAVQAAQMSNAQPKANAPMEPEQPSVVAIEAREQLKALRARMTGRAVK